MATAEVQSLPAFSSVTLENARKAKMSTESFYENLLVQARDRNNRYVEYSLAWRMRVAVCGV